MKKGIFFREWCVIAWALGFLGAIIASVYGSTITKLEVFPKGTVAYFKGSAKQIEIHLMGEVKEPGVYLCKPGTLLKEIISLASLSPLADRKKIPYRRALLVSQRVDIPKKEPYCDGVRKISLEENGPLCYSLDS